MFQGPQRDDQRRLAEAEEAIRELAAARARLDAQLNGSFERDADSDRLATKLAADVSALAQRVGDLQRAATELVDPEVKELARAMARLVQHGAQGDHGHDPQ